MTEAEQDAAITTLHGKATDLLTRVTRLEGFADDLLKGVVSDKIQSQGQVIESAIQLLISKGFKVIRPRQI